MAQALQEKIRKSMVAAMADFRMIEPEDRVMVAVSGGKDSTTLLLMLEQIQKRAPFSFSIQPVILDQKQPGFNVQEFKEWLKTRGHELVVLEEDTYSVVKEKTSPGKSYCRVCSRLRRGILYTFAHNNGYNKIALGHHRNDLNETALLNMFYGGKLATMPPYLRSDDKRNTVIRPLAYVAERDIRKLAELEKYPIIPCQLCGSQDGLMRQRVKAFLETMEGEYEGLGSSMLAALGKVDPNMLLDPRLRNDGRGTRNGHHVNSHTDL